MIFFDLVITQFLSGLLIPFSLLGSMSAYEPHGIASYRHSIKSGESHSRETCGRVFDYARIRGNTSRVGTFTDISQVSL